MLWFIGFLVWGFGRFWMFLIFGVCCVEIGIKRMKSLIWWLMGLKVMVGVLWCMGWELGGCDIEWCRCLLWWELVCMVFVYFISVMCLWWRLEVICFFWGVLVLFYLVGVFVGWCCWYLGLIKFLLMFCLDFLGGVVIVGI